MTSITHKWNRTYEVDGEGGFRVSYSDLSGDGKSLLVIDAYFNHGSVRVYKPGDNGSWSIKGSKIIGESSNQVQSAAISDDGNILAVSRRHKTDIYHFEGQDWVQILMPTN